MYMCMYVCMYVYIYIYIHTYVCIIPLCLSLSLYIYIYIYTLHISIYNILKGLFPLLVGMDTEDPERLRRRALMHDALGALMEPPELDVKALALAGAVSEKATFNATAATALVASVVLQSLFDVRLGRGALVDVVSWLGDAKPCAAGRCPFSAGRRTQAAFDRIFDAVAAGRGGREYLEAAEARGFQDPRMRLREMLFLTLLYGVGATADTVASALHLFRMYGRFILQLFWRDPRSFLIEAARLYPAVAGMPFRAGEEYYYYYY